MLARPSCREREGPGFGNRKIKPQFFLELFLVRALGFSASAAVFELAFGKVSEKKGIGNK